MSGPYVANLTLTVNSPSQVLNISATTPSKTLTMAVAGVQGTAGSLPNVVGTANEVIVTISGSTMTLSTPQAIATTSSPTFAALTITGTASANLFSGSGASLTHVVNSIAGTTGQITASASTGAITLSLNTANSSPGTYGSSTTIPIITVDAYGRTTSVSTETIASVAVSSLAAGSGISVSSSIGAVTVGNTGVLSIAGTTNQVNASTSTGAITLSLPQNINSGAAPTFAGTNFTSIPNAALTNNSVTVSAGTGMSGGGAVSLGGTITLTNAGVTSNVAGTGVSVSSATGSSTISIGQAVATSNTPTFAGLILTGGLDFSNTNGISAAGTNQGTATVLTSDTNVITTCAAGAGVVLPTGVGREITVINRGANALLVYPASGYAIDGSATNSATSVPVNGWLTVNCISSSQYYAIDPVTVGGTGVSVTQSNNGTITIANTGVLSITGTANQVSASASTGAITLSLPQNINSGAAPTFTGTNFTSIPNGALSNSSVTINAGSGLSGGGAVSLGGSVSLSNSGVLSITGTTNQVTASASTGAITLSLPQNINSGAAPTFSGTNFTSIPNSALSNSAVTVGTTSISLGSSSTTLAGLTSVASTSFTGSLTGNASTATTSTNLAGGAANSIPYQTGSGATSFIGAGEHDQHS